MAAFATKAFLTAPWRPQVQAVRFRNRINIQKPKPPHFERAKMIEVCKLKLPPPAPAVCLKNEQTSVRTVDEDHPYEKLLAKELKNWIDHSKFVGFLHTNPITGEETFKASVLMFRQGIHYRIYGKSIVKRAVIDTPYEPILHLFTSQNAMLFSEKTDNLSKLLKILKKVPQLVLMAGIVEGRLMSRAQLERYATMPDLTMARAQLVSLLAGAAGPGARLVSQLNTHQQSLVSNLEQRIQQLKPEEPPAQT